MLGAAASARGTGAAAAGPGSGPVDAGAGRLPVRCRASVGPAAYAAVMPETLAASPGPAAGSPGPAAGTPTPGPAGPVGAPGRDGRDGGPSRLGALSPSRAGDFMRCPLLYRFRVVDRLPERPSEAAVRGTLVHAVLEKLFDLPAGERTLDRAVGLLPAAWEGVVDAEPAAGIALDPEAPFPPADPDDIPPPSPEAVARLLADGESLVAQYFRMEDPTRLEPAERELRVEVLLDSGLELHGYVDRLDVAPGGLMRVVDYKTGKAPRDGFEAGPMFQMRFYALVLWRMHGAVPTRLQLLYLGSGEVLTYDPDEDDLQATERKVEALWSAILRAHESGDWRPAPSRLCDWCSHQAICPAFGGTPPPLPGSGAPGETGPVQRED